MRLPIQLVISLGLILSLTIVLSCIFIAEGATPYKVYRVTALGGKDILCDRYVVQSGDHVWEILRRKGRIAEQDFPKFVRIFKELNPSIGQSNIIFPGQELIIPLKEIDPGPDETKDSDIQRFVTVPIIPDIFYATRKVQTGESLSQIVAQQLMLKWNKIPDAYFEQFRRLNPSVKNFNRIYPGQIIRLPDMTVVPSIGKKKSESAKALAANHSDDSMHHSTSPAWRKSKRWMAEIPNALDALGIKYLSSGKCYFPVAGQPDMVLDLERYPVMEMGNGRQNGNGRRILLNTDGGLSSASEAKIRMFWPKVAVIPINPEESDITKVKQLLNSVLGEKPNASLTFTSAKDGIEVTLRGDWVVPQANGSDGYQCVTLIDNSQEKTSSWIVNYLAKRNIQVVDIIIGSGPSSDVTSTPAAKQVEDCRTALPSGAGSLDLESLVSELALHLGRIYEPNTPISFEYAGYQVQTFASVIHEQDGPDIIVDFGTFYGETKHAVEKTGIKIISIGPKEDVTSVTRKMLDAADFVHTENPQFFAANRNTTKTISLAIPGTLASRPGQHRLFFPSSLIPKDICQFLREKEISVIDVGNDSRRDLKHG